jgi:orotidine-5'-phosphate decarboxylase
MSDLIRSNKTVIVAADTEAIVDFRKLLEATKDIAGIGGYKLGMLMGLEGIGWSVAKIREKFTGKFPVIYDHQKAGNDIPEMGGPLARKLKSSGIDAAILFPFAGPATQKEWTKACQGEGLTVLTGGIMTHPNFLVSEGGYISDDAPERIIKMAIELGVTDFIAPGNKVPWVDKIRSWAEEALGTDGFTINAPGFIKQHGVLSDCAKVAGNRWHAIIGTAIYGKPTVEEMKQAAINLTAGMEA